MKNSIISLVISFVMINIAFGAEDMKTYLLEFKTNLTPYQKKQIGQVLSNVDLNSWKVKLNNKQLRLLKKLNVFSYIEEDNSLKVGSLATFSSVMPWTAVVSAGIGRSGLTNQVLLSLLPFGNTLSIEISTILSLATFTPVVSRSKKQMGLVSFNSIFYFYCYLKFGILVEQK